MSTRDPRTRAATVPPDKVKRRQCRACGQWYYIHLAVADQVDTGCCVSCDSDIAELCRMWYLTAYLTRPEAGAGAGAGGGCSDVRGRGVPPGGAL